MGIHLDEAGLDDLDVAVPLFDAYRQFYGYPSDPIRCRDFLQKRISQAESKVFLARVEQRPAGFMQLYPSFGSLSLRPVWILYDLFVAPTDRKSGIGTALLERARLLGIESGASELSLATAIDNLNAQRVYERHGWKRDNSFYYYNLTI